MDEKATGRRVFKQQRGLDRPSMMMRGTMTYKLLKYIARQGCKL